MSKGWSYNSGQWSFICDSCGQKLKSGVARERWDGFRVCPECWEPRHPQDFLRTKPDNQSIPWSRPQTTDVFIVVNPNLYWDEFYIVAGYIEGDVV